MNKTSVQARIQVRNILFLTDFSDASSRAAVYANDLAKTYGARLVAQHVRPPVINPMTPPASWHGLEEAAKVEDDNHREELSRMFTDVNPHVIIAEGDFWSSVNKTIEGESIDLIVMGTRGRSGVARMALGSVAEETFRRAPCPVLTVGPQAEASANRKGEFATVLFATDLTPEANRAVEYALSIAQENQSRLVLMHVIDEPKANDHVLPRDVAPADERLLHSLVPVEAAAWCAPEILIEFGDTAEKILDVAKRRKAQLIVMGVRKEHGIGGAATHLPLSTVHDVVSNAHCPVLTIPV